MLIENYFEIEKDDLITDFSSEKLVVNDERLRMIYETLSFTEEIKVKKGTIILQSGIVCKDSYFIKEGLVREYYLKPNGKEVIQNFYKENSGFSSFESIANDEPSMMSYQAIEDCVFYVIKKEDFDLVLKNNKSCDELVRICLADRIVLYQKRLYSIQFESAEERYLQLLEDFPQITNRVSSIHIASYLGITPETLSRIRSMKEVGKSLNKNYILKAV